MQQDNLFDNLDRESLLEKQHVAIANSMDGIALLDAEGKYYYLNDVHLKMFGYEKQEELLGKTWTFIYGPEEIERIGKDLFPLLMADGKWAGETIGLNKLGLPVYQEISLTSLPDGGLVCICRDISDKKKNREKLEIYEQILKTTDSIAIVTNVENRIEWVNVAFTKITGYIFEEVVGKRPGSLLQGKDSNPETIAYMHEQLLKGLPFNCEILNYKKEGKSYWVEIKSQPLFNSNGEVERYFSIQEDITERKETERILKENSLRLQYAMEGANGAFWDWDIVKSTVYYSLQWKSLLGYSGDEISDNFSEWKSRVHPEDVEKTLEKLTAYQLGETDSFRTYLRIQHKKGHYLHWLDQGIITERNNDGEPLRMVGAAIDVTELRETQQKLKESEERLEVALDASGNGIWDWNVETGETIYSIQWKKMLGYEENEIQSSIEECRNRIHPADRAVCTESMRKYLNGETNTYDCQQRLLAKDGRYIWTIDRGLIVKRNLAGKPTRVIGTNINISDIKQAEEKLSKSEERWRMALEGAGAGIWEWDIANKNFEFSDRHNESLGFEIKDAVPGDYEFWLERVHPDDVIVITEDLDEHRSGQQHYFQCEFRCRNKQMEYNWLEVRGVISQKLSNGEPSKMIGSSYNIQEKKMIAEKLKSSEARWNFALEGTGAGIWDWDLVNDSVFYSDRALEIINYERVENESTIQVFEAIVHPEDLERVVNVVKVMQTGINKSTLQYRVKNRQSEFIWIEDNAMVVQRDASGKATRILGSFIDISDRKKIEIELVKSKELAESLVKKERRFLANISHELRTPLHAVIGLSEQLVKSELAPQQKEFVTIINDSASHLLELISDVLDLSKIAEGKIKLEETTFSFTKILYESIQLIDKKGIEKGIVLKIEECDFENNHFVKGDPLRLKQIFLNILSNSVKFTQKGHIEIKYWIQTETDQKKYYKIIFSDTGIGMDEIMISKLFGDFVQGDETFARKYGGSGLGLSITRKLVEMMKGHIEISSKKEVGTNVAILIPFDEVDIAEYPEEIKTFEEKDFRNLRVLLAEDSTLNRLVATTILKRYEIYPDKAINGKEVIEKLSSEMQYDLILMDVQMPEMDGIEATQYIRQKLKLDIPIIAVTANAIKEELDSYLLEGMNDYITKPFEEKTLIDKIIRWAPISK
jgi:PAS domain S-box-containing protein